MAHRYLKGVGKSSAPVVLVVACAETDSVPGARSSDTQFRRAVAVWCTKGRRVGTRWYGSADPERMTVPEWWTWIESQAVGRRRVYVISPTASDMLTLTGFWDHATDGRFKLLWQPDDDQGDDLPAGKERKPTVGRLVMAGRPDIIDCRSGGGSLTFLSARNYGDVDLGTLGISVGGDGALYSALAGLRPGHRDRVAAECTALTAYFRSLVSRWVAEGNGPWRETVGQCVLSLWRARFYSEKVCRHSDPEASELEAEANYGGRASVWYWGSVGDPATLPGDCQPIPPLSPWRLRNTSAHRLDVRSMYPTLLRDREFPTRLLSVRDSVPESDWDGWTKHVGCIARVELETDIGEYPMRDRDRLRFPAGRFWTTLAGPELREAFLRGHLRRIGQCARYALGKPLAAVAGHLLSERQRAMANHDILGASWLKLLANSLGGKFAQRADRWIAAPSASGGPEWGEWIMDRGETDEPWRMRSIAGVPFRCERGKPGGKLLSAVFAYLTAYGRLQMLALREALPARSVLSQDTDGLWVTDVGLAAAESLGLLGTDEPGRLRYVETVGFARWLSPRHYYAGGQWTLAGTVLGSAWVSDREVVETRSVNPVRYRPTEAPREMMVFTARKELGELRPDVPVDALTGWSRPWHRGARLLPIDDGRDCSRPSELLADHPATSRLPD